MLQRVRVWGAVVLAWAAIVIVSDAAFTLSGSEKDVWPELLRAEVGDAVAALNASGLVKNVYVQAPSRGAPPANPGAAADVWFYTDGNGVVYEIPRRGVWHPNRLNPGWPDVAGTHYKSAISKIKQSMPNVDVIHGPKGFLRTGEVKFDRVWMDLNKDDTVAGVPAVG